MSAAVAPKHMIYQYQTDALATPPRAVNLLNAVALNAASANRTLKLQTAAQIASLVSVFGQVTIAVQYTFGTASTVTATCLASLDGGLTYNAIQASTVVAGVDTLNDYVASKTTGSANHNFCFTIPVKGYTNIEVVFSGAGAGGGDLITVQATASTI